MNDAEATSVFVLPALGGGVTDAVITRWLKGLNETVVMGEPLLEVATDKVETELLSPFSGTLARILAQEDESVKVGQELARFVFGVIEQGPVLDEASRHVALLEVASAVEDAAPQLSAVSSGGGTRTEKLSLVRRIIAGRMMQSLQSTAQLTTVVEVDVTTVARTRELYKAAGRKISYLPFIAKATIDALKLHPAFNTTVTSGGTELVYSEAVNLSIAVDSTSGLLVPVIRNAQDKTLDEISTAIADAAHRARAGRIAVSDFEGGTFTITDTGSRGALFDTPILNYPQTAILGFGAVVQKVVPLPDEGMRIGIRSFAHLALTYDHRIVDGADAARFLSSIRKYVEAVEP
ncbi:2-oxo acid dehydrogenase subunit E2 [Arthrobacter sp. RHLT1-20]